MSKPFVILPRELGQVPPPVGLVGQKARGLSQLLTLKARVPRFGVVTVTAFDEFLQLPELRVALLEAKAGLRTEDEASLIAIGERLVREAMATPLPDAVLDGIAELKRAFADDDVFAIRASVVGEDLEVRALAGQLDAALGTRDVARKDDPYNPKWIAGLTRIHLRQKNIPKMLDSLSLLASADSDDLDVRLALAERNLALGQFAEARKWAEDSLVIDTYNPRAYTTLGRSLAKQQDWAGAARAFETLLKLEPENADEIAKELADVKAKLKPGS